MALFRLRVDLHDHELIQRDLFALVGFLFLLSRFNLRSFEGELRSAEGVAWLADEAGSPAKL
jgi:hypothetical protein